MTAHRPFSRTQSIVTAAPNPSLFMISSFVVVTVPGFGYRFRCDA
jgi:hypothetical protein